MKRLKLLKSKPSVASKKETDYQLAVFAYTDANRVVLVTCRNGTSWILPKGNRARKRSDRVQAKREAFEEAGLQGSLNQRHFDFSSSSSEDCKMLRVFSMRVKKLLSNFPERRERRRILVTFDRAEKIVKKEYLGIIREMRKRII